MKLHAMLNAINDTSPSITVVEIYFHADHRLARARASVLWGAHQDITSEPSTIIQCKYLLYASFYALCHVHLTSHHQTS